MKIIKIEESNKDNQDLEILLKEKAKVEAYAKKIQDRIREIIYKYDTGKMDFTRKPKN